MMPTLTAGLFRMMASTGDESPVEAFFVAFYRQ